MEKMECTRAALECQSASQNEELEKLRREMAICLTQKQLSLEQLRQKDAKITDLQVDVENRESKIEELEERLRRAEDERRKLHNTIQELKGNIRVFCRVRPVKEDEKLCEPGTQNPIITFSPAGFCRCLSIFRGTMLCSAGDAPSDQGLTILCPSAPQQPYQEMRFTFDNVFQPDAQQETVFEEISQLVQSALDGYKVLLLSQMLLIMD